MGRSGGDRYSRDYGIPVFHREWYIRDGLKDDERERRLKLRREMMNTILSEYPTTTAYALSRETGVLPDQIERLAKEHGLTALKQASWRGGSSPMKVKKVDATGKVVATYDSINQCAAKEGIKYTRLRYMKGALTVGEYTYRLAKPPRENIDDLLLEMGIWDEEE